MAVSHSSIGKEHDDLAAQRFGGGSAERSGSDARDRSAAKTNLNGLQPAQTATIMIIDDDPAAIKLVCQWLRSAGYHDLVAVTDSTIACKMIQERTPDLVLLDVMMPEVDGLQVLQQIRANDVIGFTPVLMLTAATDRETKRRALKLGATDFLAKPIDASELVPRVRNALFVKAHREYLEYFSRTLEHEFSQRHEAEMRLRQTQDASAAAAASTLNFVRNQNGKLREHLGTIYEQADRLTQKEAWEENKGEVRATIRQEAANALELIDALDTSFVMNRPLEPLSVSPSTSQVYS